MADLSRLRQGSIVWIANAPDPQGRIFKPQPRAFVIITATDEIRPGSSMVGVAVTSSVREPVTDPALVPMRWNANGNIETGFRRKCFAKADWALPIAIDRDGEFVGENHGTFVRDRELEKILTARDRVADSDP